MSSYANKMIAVGVADASNALSRHRTLQTDMVNGCNTESTKKQHGDDVTTFDSGILSATNLSATDLAVNTVETETTTIEHPNIDSKITLQDSMRLDSGIDIDVSDQLVSSNSFSPTVEKSQRFRYDRTGHDFGASQSTVQRPTQEELWDLFFEQDENGDTQLHLAIIDGREETIRKIVSAIPDSRYLNIRNYYFQTALHLSVLCDQPNIVRLLLLAGANIGFEDTNGNTALHLACQTSNFHCINALLSPVTVYERKYVKFSFKPVIDSPSEYLNEYNYDGLTCVHIATKQQNTKILSLLFQYGADVNIRECKSGYTILHEAVARGNLALTKNILQHNGIDIEKKNYEKLTPLQLSTEYPHVAQFLLENGAIRIVEEEESDDEDYSSDDSDDEYCECCSNSIRVNQVAGMMHSLRTKRPIETT